MCTIRKMSLVLVVVALSVVVGWGKEVQDTGKLTIRAERKAVTADVTQREPAYMGRPLSFWLKCIEGCDEETMEAAFDALIEFGPDAWKAVPELTRIVAEPFIAIHIGVDSRAAVRSKLRSIELRASAIDTLAAIGSAAATSTFPLIQWALTVRVIPPATHSASVASDEDLFVDLIAIDVLERMRVAGAVAQFGAGATSAVEDLLESTDGERRKLAVAILNAGALPIAADLLKSPSCRDRVLGISILADMWPVVAKDHLVNLKGLLVCDAD